MPLWSDSYIDSKLYLVGFYYSRAQVQSDGAEVGSEGAVKTQLARTWHRPCYIRNWYNMPMNLRDEILAGESPTLEFKRNIPDLAIKYLKTVSAFANCSGGKIIFGVDADQSVCGMDTPFAAWDIADEKLDIGSGKLDIEAQKLDIGPKKLDIGGLPKPTQRNILAIFNTLGREAYFKRADIKNHLGLSLTGISNLLATMLKLGLIESVAGHGKGAYRWSRSL